MRVKARRLSATLGLAGIMVATFGWIVDSQSSTFLIVVAFAVILTIFFTYLSRSPRHGLVLREEFDSALDTFLGYAAAACLCNLAFAVISAAFFLNPARAIAAVVLSCCGLSLIVSAKGLHINAYSTSNDD